MSAKEVRVAFRGIDKTRQAFASIKQNFAKLGEQSKNCALSFGKIGTAITAAFSVHAIKQIIDTGEKIGRLAPQLAMTTEGLSELKYAAETVGVQFNTLTSGLENMISRISEASDGSGRANDALLELGLSAERIKNLEPEIQFSIMAEALSKVEDGADRARLATEIFGNEGKELLKVMQDGAFGLNKMREEANRLGLSLSEDQVIAMTEFNQSIRKLQITMQGLIVEVLQPILPMLNEFLSLIKEGHPLIKIFGAAIGTLLAFKLALWFTEAASAVRIFTVALMANPFGMIAVGATVAIALIITLVEWLGRSKEKIDEHNKVVAKSKELLSGVTAENKAVVNSLMDRVRSQEQFKVKVEASNVSLEKQSNSLKKLNNSYQVGGMEVEDYSLKLSKSKKQVDELKNSQQELFDLISKESGNAASEMINNLTKAQNGAERSVKSMKSIFNDFFSNLQNQIMKLAMDDLFGGVNSGGGGLLGNLFSGLFGGGGFAGLFAEGGRARAGKAHIVGDGGEPELFIPSSSGTIIPFSKLANNQGGNIIVNMNIQTPDVSSFNYSRSQIAAQLASQIALAKRNM